MEQLVAPIALYPDSLLAQVLMASTYPLEVVQADRWVKQNPKLKDSADALNKLTWDPSVKSLAGFPQVLTMMSEKLDWTVKLGDAFLADQKGVMEAVQRLRGKAYAKGNLQTTNEQKVTVEPVAAGSAAAGSASQVIVVESANPSVMYVPTYNPTVVYGGWAYPSYPPYYYYPPGYAAGAAMVSFGVGMAVGAAWGHAWGGCNWHGGDVDIDVNRNVNVNQSIDRNAYKNQVNNRAGGTSGRGTWQHDASHRKGVAYRDTATTERYRGTDSTRSTAQSRDAYRGRTEAGRQDLSRGGASDYRGSGGGGGSTGGYRTNSSGSRGSTASSRDYSGTRSSSFSGVDSGSSSARAASSRGQASRSSSYSSSGGRSGGGSYSGGGGGSRGGGGGGGRGGGGGGRR